MFGASRAAAALLAALHFVAQPTPAYCNRVHAAELQTHRQVLASASASAGDNDTAQETRLEDEESELAVLKCSGAPALSEKVAKRRHLEKGWKMAGKLSGALLEQEAAAGSDANASASALADGAEGAHFVDFQCDVNEMEHFKKKFGLSGGGGFPEANFGYKGICEEKNVLWLYPMADSNGAFNINANVCHRLLTWSDIACSVQVRRVGSVQQAIQYLSRFPDNSIMHAVLGGHGMGVALQWGPGEHGFLGVQEKRHPVGAGNIVIAQAPVQTINKVKKTILPGDTGYVLRIDGDGDVQVYFERHGYQWIARGDVQPDAENFDIQHSSVPEFLQTLSSKMQAHGSIFTDSCKSASSAYNPNFAQFIAQNAGKGVRVIGSEVSFGKVDVKRFQGWHASLNTKEMQHAQRVYVNSDARCPSMALWSHPDAVGNCRCRRFQTCSTRSGKSCPAANNQVSDTYFLPFCGENWAEDPCVCSSSSRPWAAWPKLVVGSLLAMLRG